MDLQYQVRMPRIFSESLTVRHTRRSRVRNATNPPEGGSEPTARRRRTLGSVTEPLVRWNYGESILMNIKQISINIFWK